jgi:hypothetical protein
MLSSSADRFRAAASSPASITRKHLLQACTSVHRAQAMLAAAKAGPLLKEAGRVQRLGWQSGLVGALSLRHTRHTSSQLGATVL